MKTNWSEYTISYDGVDYAVNYRDNGDLIATSEDYVLKSPSPNHPQPIQTTIPAGTYKVQDHKGDWYEFTLTEDLQGIGSTKDSIEYDKYSHKGYLRLKFSKKVFDGSETWYASATTDTNIYRYYSNVDNLKTISSGEMPLMFCTHYPIIAGGATYNKIQGCSASTSSNQAIYIFDNNINGQNTTPFKNWLASLHANGTPLTVVYQLATPTRTQLTFVKNNDSTAPVFPFVFLTDTPSEEYPASVFDSVGKIVSMGQNLFDYKKPPIRLVAVSHELIQGGVQITKNGTGWQNVYWSIPKTLAGKDVTIVFDADDEVSMSQNYVRLRWGNDLTNLESAGTSYNMKYGKNVCVFSVPTAVCDYDYFCFHIQRQQNKDGSLYLTKMMVLEGNYATQNLPQYVPYFGEPVAIGFPTLRKVGEIADEYNLKSGQVIRRIGYIESYNGEDVTTEYISSTGGLDTGAEIRYVLPEPITEQLEPKTLPTFANVTVIETICDNVATPQTQVTLKVFERNE